MTDHKATDAPAEQPGPEQWYEALLAIERGALAAGQYEIPYHALAAALHCAEAARDLAGAERVAALAEEHRRRIDAEEPPHRFGSRAAAQRGHPGVFEQLVGQAPALLARLEGAEALKRAPRLSWPDREPQTDSGTG
jgi:hypothetical protein